MKNLSPRTIERRKRPIKEAAADFLAAYRDPTSGLPNASWDL